MARLSVWVLAGLALFALAGHELHVNADTPTEYECRPYIEKAIQDLKTGTDATASQEEEENVTTEEPSSTESPVDVTSQEEEDNTAAEETSIEEDVPEETEPLTASEEVQEAIFDNAAEQAEQEEEEATEEEVTGSEEGLEDEDELTASEEEQEQEATEEATGSEEETEDGEDELTASEEEQEQEQEQEATEEVTGSEEETEDEEEEELTASEEEQELEQEATEEATGSEEETEDEDDEEQLTESEEAAAAASDDEQDYEESATESQEDVPVSGEEDTETDDDQDDEEDDTEDQEGDDEQTLSGEEEQDEEEDDEETDEEDEQDQDDEEDETEDQEEEDEQTLSGEEEQDEEEDDEETNEEENDEGADEEDEQDQDDEEDDTDDQEGDDEQTLSGEEEQDEEEDDEETDQEDDEDQEDQDDEDDEEQADEEEASAEQQESDDTDASPEAVDATEASQEQEETEELDVEESTEAVEEVSEELAVEEETTSTEASEQTASEETELDEPTSEEVVEPSAEETETVETADSLEASTEPASEELSAVEEEGSEEVVASEEAAPASEEEPAPVESAEEAEPLPEEDLLLEYEIPTNRRDTSHIYELLNINDESADKEAALHKVADVILRDLKKTYDTAIKPLETLYKYRDLSNRHFGDPEIFSKPLILFMGPWSGGKSTILNYLTKNEYTPNSVRTGAEPSPAYFNILMHGDEPEVLDGTQLAADWTFSGLQKFGQGLLDRLRGQKLPNKLLERVNIVEIPGILEVRKQVSQYFPFNDACQWFIDRADIIFLVYDPSKLDVGPETEAILDQLKGREYQTRILLNKADQVKPEELLRVQGALIWNISPLMSSAQPPVMYTVSLWSNPFETGAPTRLLQAQERSLLLDLGQAIEKRIENKIASARRFAVRVRNHAKMVDCYLTTYYNHKTLFANKKYVSDQIIGNPQQYHIYEGLSTLTNISRYDLPDPESYRDFFQLNPLYEFQKLSETCTYFRGCPINKLDIAIAYDLPELVGKYKKLAEAALEKLQIPSQTTDFGRLKASS